jgi:hypothetical protein
MSKKIGTTAEAIVALLIPAILFTFGMALVVTGRTPAVLLGVAVLLYVGYKSIDIVLTWRHNVRS